jgi:hypothetical protein
VKLVLKEELQDQLVTVLMDIMMMDPTQFAYLVDINVKLVKPKNSIV